MSAQDILSLLQTRGVSVETHLSAQQIRAEWIAKYRRYAEGDHDARLTSAMRNLLSIKSSPLDEGGHPYNVNYMALIVDTMVDRLNLTSIDADNQTATDWISDLLEAQRIDALQLGIHEAAVRDGDTFLLVDYDNDEAAVRWTHEPAYDGTNGVMVFYETTNARKPFLAVKLWCVKGYEGELIERTRCNLYFDNRIERYYRDTTSSGGTGDWLPYTDDGYEAVQAWDAGVVPVVHFRNKSTRHNNYGTSDLKSVIPLQDTLNATNVSMVSTSQLTGFPIRWAKGFTPPAGVTPGMWITMGDSGLTSEQVVDLGVMEQGEILPFVQQAQFTIMQIATISRTPIPELVNADSGASGESLKQRESGLLGKIRRAQIGFGNAWEDVIETTKAVLMAYGVEAPPDWKSISARWESGEVRNDTAVIDNAIKVAPKVGDAEFLRLIAPVFGYDAAKIEQILEDKAEQDAAKFEQMASTFGGAPPQFGSSGSGQARPMMPQNRGNSFNQTTRGN